MALNFSIAGDKGLVSADFPLTAESAESVREKVFRWMDSCEPLARIVMDLSAVSVMDSAGLGVLMAIRKEAVGRGGEFVVAALQPKPRIVFEITHADRVIPVFPSVADALQAAAPLRPDARKA